jgi:hypothetical protein
MQFGFDQSAGERRSIDGEHEYLQQSVESRRYGLRDHA